MRAYLRPFYEQGRRARGEGALAADNPHTGWSDAVAWTAGWHHVSPADCVSPSTTIERQTAEVAWAIWGDETLRPAEQPVVIAPTGGAVAATVGRASGRDGLAPGGEM
jgi:hypothetical protein